MKTADCQAGIIEASSWSWKAKYDGLEVSEAKRLKGLESENSHAEEAIGRRHARQRSSQGPTGKKMVTADPSDEAVAHILLAADMGERRTCRTTIDGEVVEEPDMKLIESDRTNGPDGADDGAQSSGPSGLAP